MNSYIVSHRKKTALTESLFASSDSSIVMIPHCFLNHYSLLVGFVQFFRAPKVSVIKRLGHLPVIFWTRVVIHA